MSPGDVALMSTLPDWDIFVPGHPDEVEAILRGASATDRRTYLRLSDQHNEAPMTAAAGGLELIRPASSGSPLVVAVGPTRDAVLAATTGRDVAVAYTARPFPLDVERLRGLVAQDVVWVEP
jgi:transketolase